MSVAAGDSLLKVSPVVTGKPLADKGTTSNTSIVGEVVKGSLTTGLGFGLGCLSGRIFKGPVIITGVIFAVSALATFVFDLATRLLAKNFGWNLSTVNFAKAITGAVVAIALAVTTFALGIIGPIGLGVGIGLGVLFSAAPLVFGLTAKFSGKDIPYTEAVKEKSLFYKLSIAFAA